MCGNFDGSVLDTIYLVMSNEQLDDEALVAYLAMCLSRGQVMRPADALPGQPPAVHKSIKSSMNLLLRAVAALKGDVEDAWWNSPDPETVPLPKMFKASGDQPLSRQTGSSSTPSSYLRRDDMMYPDNSEDLTTLMVQNIPVRCRQSQLLEIWRPNGTFDFFYAPYNSKRRHFCGYAFINFLSREALEQFRRTWEGQILPNWHSKKPLRVTYSSSQGLQALLSRFEYREPSAIEEVHVPAVFCGARQLNFWEAFAKRGTPHVLKQHPEA